MRIKERPRRFLAVVLVLLLVLGSIPEAISHVVADAVTEEEKTREKTGCEITIRDTDTVRTVTDSAIELKYRLVVTGDALVPASTAEPFSESAQEGRLAIPFVSDEVKNAEAVKGIQLVDISYENYTSAMVKDTLLEKDSFVTDGNVGTNIAEGFLSKEELSEEGFSILLSGRPEFTDTLTLTAKDASEAEVAEGNWAKSVEISGSIAKPEEEADYSAYSVYWYEKENRTDTKIEHVDENGSFTFTVLEEGEKTYCFYVKKDVDGISYLSREQSISVKKDATAPEVTIATAAMAEGNWASNISITGTAVDAISEIESMYYAWDDGDGQYKAEDGENKIALEDTAFSEADDTGKITFGFLLTANEKVYKNRNLYVIAVDKAGNEGVEEVTLNLDGVKPEIKNIRPEDIAEWTGKAISVTFQAIDVNEQFPEQSNIKGVYYRVKDGDTVTATSVQGEDDTYAFTIPGEKTFEGNYTIWCEDTAGNISEIKEIAIKIDKNACIISDVKADPDDWTNGEVTVTGTIRDNHSGVAEDSIKYYKEGAADLEKKPDTIVSNDKEKKEINYSFKLEADDYAGNYIIYGEDVVGNTTYAAVFVKMDITKPKVQSVKLSSTEWLKENETLVVTGSVFDVVKNNAASDIAKVCYGKIEQDERVEIASSDVDALNKTDDHTYEYRFEISNSSQIDETYYVWCEDKAGNKSEISQQTAFQVKFDTESPVVSADVSNTKWTNQAVTISGRVSDVTEKHGAGSGIQQVYVVKEGNVTGEAVTVNDAGEFVYTINTNTNAEYVVVAVDKVGHEKRSDSFHIRIDTDNPSILEKDISAKSWTKDETVSLSVTMKDESKEGTSSGVSKVCWRRNDDVVKGEEKELQKGNNGEVAAKISFGLVEADKGAFAGDYTIWCVDEAGNVSSEETVTVSIDQVKGVLEAWTVEPVGKETGRVVDTSEWITGAAIVKGVAYDADSGVKKVSYKTAKTATGIPENNREGSAKSEGLENQYSFPLEPQDYEGDYVIQIEDYAGNINNLNVAVKMDKTQPKVVEKNSGQKEGEWTKDSLEITGELQDNLSGVAGIYYSVEEKSVREQTATEGAIENAVQADGRADFKFTLDNTSASYDQIDRIYVWCEDTAGNLSEEVEIPIRLDNTKPELTDVRVELEEEATILDTLLKIFTLGVYKAPTKVKVIVNDNSRAGERKSDIASVYWEYQVINKMEGSGIVESLSATMTVDEKTLTEGAEEGTWEGILEFNENYRGTLDFLVTDSAGNECRSEANVDGERSILIDRAAPVFEGYAYPQAQTHTPNIYYYNDTAVVGMQIREANFQYNAEAEKEVLVRDNGRGQSVATWDSPDGVTWRSNIMINGEGEHVIETSYTDPAGNDMAVMQSETIVIDRTAPVISVSYDQNNNNRYYDTTRWATISIQEVNFDASRVEIKIPRTNVLGEDIGEITYNGANLNWNHNGNIHTAQIGFPGDANYALQITATDLADNKAREFNDSFTVDTSAPLNLSVSYGSLNSFSRSVDGATFTNYYNDQIQVTISATDTTSGVERFIYSYKKGDGVSGVNAELINAVLEQTEIVQNGNEYSATFYIPREALGNSNQFNGMVDFTAYDWAGNSSMLQDNRRIIVDNITPTAEITYSEPVREVNGVAYYDGNIEATIVINEANFDAGTVEVQLEQDGNTSAVSPSWTDDTTDIHTGRFTINGDGDYRVSVNYTDYSDNQMAEYRSEQMTIDTEAPTIAVSGIRANSATNSEENFAFTITAQDTNLDSSTFKPVLTAVVPDEQGNYQTTEISLGEMTETPNGEKIASATYSVENLERDAFYTLTCTVSDMVNHTNGNGAFSLTDKEGNNGGEMEQVQFSINREGSTFHVTKQTEKILSDYYVKNLEDSVVVEEINVDPIENYTVELNGETLGEGEGNYTSTSEGNGADGSWCRRTYSLNSALFEQEGEYNIVVHSTDKAETTAYSDVKNVKVAFVVDETAPTVTISGLSENGNYQTTEQKVTVLPKDDGGKLNSFEALVDGESQMKLSGEELEAYLEEHDGSLELYVPEGINKEVEIICMDCAIDQSGNGEDYNIYRETFGNITVSPNRFVLFFANKPLFYGSIAGVVLLGAFLVFIIVYVKKRNKKMQ